MKPTDQPVAAEPPREFDEPPEPQMDWQQVALNGGPPCFDFTIGDTHFCGRSERWEGHGIIHGYVSLRDYINECANAAFRTKEILRAAVSQPSAPEPRDDAESLDGIICMLIAAVQQHPKNVLNAKPEMDRILRGLLELDRMRGNVSTILTEMCETETRCRTLLAIYDKSSSDGVIPLDEVVTTALTSTRSELLKQIREAVEAEQVEDDGSGVWDAGHYDGINDALAAIDRVAKTSQTESTNQSETRAVDGEWQPPIDLTKHFAKHPHVSLVDGVLGGVTPIVSKIRISVTHVLGYLYHGKSIPEIGKTYSLSEEAVRDAIAFAHDVYDEVIHGPDDDDDE